PNIGDAGIERQLIAHRARIFAQAGHQLLRLGDAHAGLHFCEPTGRLDARTEEFGGRSRRSVARDQREHETGPELHPLLMPRLVENHNSDDSSDDFVGRIAPPYFERRGEDFGRFSHDSSVWSSSWSLTSRMSTGLPPNATFENGSASRWNASPVFGEYSSGITTI